MFDLDGELECEQMMETNREGEGAERVRERERGTRVRERERGNQRVRERLQFG